MELQKLLGGGDLRSTGRVNDAIRRIKDQQRFDQLFEFLFSSDRLVVMRAADAIEKITISNPEFLSKHKLALFELCSTSVNKELQWHLALLLPRLKLDEADRSNALAILKKWLTYKGNSRIVRVNALQ